MTEHPITDSGRNNLTNLCDDLYFHYWGKVKRSDSPDGPDSWHLLPYHGLDVAAVSYTLLREDVFLREKFMNEQFKSDEYLVSFISYLIALHDIGKFSDRFQDLVPSLASQLRQNIVKGDYTIRHDSLGLVLWNKSLKKHLKSTQFFLRGASISPLDWDVAFWPLISAVMGHHGRPPLVEVPGEVPDRHFSQENEDAALQYAKTCSEIFFPEQIPFGINPFKDFRDLTKRLSWLLAGLVVVSDWIGSDERVFPNVQEVMPLSTYWQKVALPTAWRAVRQSGMLPSRVASGSGLQVLFRSENFQASPMQAWAETSKIGQGSQLYIIEDSTGSGKTETALVLAHRLMQAGHGNGIFFALPTMATANAMYGRLSHAYDNLFSEGEVPSLVLSHSARHLSGKFHSSFGFEDQPLGRSPKGSDEDSAESLCTEWLADNRKKALLASVGVGTIDQALLSVLPARHQSLRLLGLARNVLIIDEVHAFDAYMNRLIGTLISFHTALGGSTILLSATLPKKTRFAFVQGFTDVISVPGSDSPDQDGYPLVTRVNAESETVISLPCRPGTEKTVIVQFFHHYREVLDLIARTSKSGQCIAWVRNTVGDAIKGYEDLVTNLSEDRVSLFHARFTAHDRFEKEHSVLNWFGRKSTPETRSGRVLVATQVVEQSLDLDFDVMVTDLAPIDLIIQRAGRLQRHLRGDRSPAVLYVYSPPLDKGVIREDWYSSFFPKAAWVYPRHGELFLTARKLQQKGSFTLPDDARELIEGIYGESVRPEKPEPLGVLDDRDYAEQCGDKQFAEQSTLDVRTGYHPVTGDGVLGHWSPEERVMTRLSDESTVIRMLIWDGSRIRPFHDEGRYSWEMSQVNVPDSYVKEAPAPDGACASAVSLAREAMPDKGRWCLLLPVREVGDGRYSAKVIDKKGGSRTFLYDSRTGARILKDGTE